MAARRCWGLMVSMLADETVMRLAWRVSWLKVGRVRRGSSCGSAVSCFTTVYLVRLILANG